MIIYQDMIKLLRFLFNYKLFKNNLIYKSCRILKFIKNNKEIKIYSKIYTVD